MAQDFVAHQIQGFIDDSLGNQCEIFCAFWPLILSHGDCLDLNPAMIRSGHVLAIRKSMKLGKKKVQIVPTPKVTWILAANRVRAAFFRKEKGDAIEFLRRFENPEARLREQDLVSDSPGKSQSSASAGHPRHALGREAVWHEKAAVDFSRKLIKEISRSYEQGKFDELILIAEPHFLGFLRSALPKHLASAPRRELNRELKFIDTKRVEKRVLALLKEPGFRFA